MPPPAADANIGFTLTPESRTALMRLMDGLAGELPQASVLLTDLAGRIVDVARKPLGVKLEGIAALAAGVFASTTALATSMGDDSFSLVFEHEADKQVYVRPIADRGLLVVLLKGGAAADQLDDRLEGQLGTDLADVLTGGRQPLQAVPPPRVDTAAVPDALTAKVRALGVRLLDVETRKAGALAPEVYTKILCLREDLVQAMARKDWDGAEGLCRTADAWVAGLPG